MPSNERISMALVHVVGLSHDAVLTNVVVVLFADIFPVFGQGAQTFVHRLTRHNLFATKIINCSNCVGYVKCCVH